MENVERRSCLSAANFPYLPVLGTPLTHKVNSFGDGRQEEGGVEKGQPIRENVAVAHSDASFNSGVRTTFNNRPSPCNCL